MDRLNLIEEELTNVFNVLDLITEDMEQNMDKIDSKRLIKILSALYISKNTLIDQIDTITELNCMEKDKE